MIHANHWIILDYSGPLLLGGLPMLTFLPPGAAELPVEQQGLGAGQVAEAWCRWGALGCGLRDRPGDAGAGWRQGGWRAGVQETWKDLLNGERLSIQKRMSSIFLFIISIGSTKESAGIPTNRTAGDFPVGFESFLFSCNSLPFFSEMHT